MNVSKRRRISLSLFEQDDGFLIGSHLVTWETKRKEKKRKRKKLKSPLKFWDCLIFLFFFLPLLLLKRNFVFVKPVLTNSNNYFRQIPQKKSSKIKCGMCGFFSMWRQFLTRCQRCAFSPAFSTLNLLLILSSKNV